jgi:hypothetical protein
MSMNRVTTRFVILNEVKNLKRFPRIPLPLNPSLLLNSPRSTFNPPVGITLILILILLNNDNNNKERGFVYQIFQPQLIAKRTSILYYILLIL